MKKNIIEVKNLTYKYRSNQPGEGDTALDNICLDIEEGSFVAILGRNGSESLPWQSILTPF